VAVQCTNHCNTGATQSYGDLPQIYKIGHMFRDHNYNHFVGSFDAGDLVFAMVHLLHL